jgi:hypothetical protein
MERRSLAAGISHIANADPEAVRRYVTQEPAAVANYRTKTEPKRHERPEGNAIPQIGVIPVTVRLKPAIACALKRASLERELAGESPFTQRELIEEALGAWLRKHDYLKP